MVRGAWRRKRGAPGGDEQRGAWRQGVVRSRWCLIDRSRCTTLLFKKYKNYKNSFRV